MSLLITHLKCDLTLIIAQEILLKLQFFIYFQKGLRYNSHLRYVRLELQKIKMREMQIGTQRKEKNPILFSV